MTVVALSNRKGGTGKTTTAVNLAACLAEQGQRVLLIDLDPQANATSSFGLTKAAGNSGSLALLHADADLESQTQASGIAGLEVVAAGSDLAGAEFDLAREDGWETLLVATLANHGRDFVILDTPPALGVLSVNALAAADGVVIPLQCDYFSLEGLQEFAANLNQLRAKINPRLSLLALVKTMYDNRTLLSRQVSKELDRYFGNKVLPTAIPRNVRLAEAPSHGLPIILHAPSSSGAQAYRELTHEFLQMLE